MSTPSSATPITSSENVPSTTSTSTSLPSSSSITSTSTSTAPSTAAAAAALLTRSILGDADPFTAHSRDLSRTSVSSVDGPPSRRASTSTSRRSQVLINESGELLEPLVPKNTDELNDLLKELQRNQLWFQYVLTSAREQFQNGPQQQADSIQKTLDDLALAVDTTNATKKRMADIQRRVDTIKTKVVNWRQKQILAEGVPSSQLSEEQRAM